MTQYNTLNLRLFDFQINELKSEIKKGTEVTLKIGDSNDENNFPYKLWPTYT